MKATQLYSKHNGDGAASHQAKLTVMFLHQNVPNFIESFVWPLNSPDITPVD